MIAENAAGFEGLKKSLNRQAKIRNCLAFSKKLERQDQGVFAKG
jgi:hypothetical protein